MTMAWPALPYEEWQATRDTLHAHTQVLGKIQTRLAPPEPELLHSALRLTVRGWETRLLPAPDGSGGFGIALDLHRHEAIVRHVDGRERVVPLMPNRAVRDVTHDVLASVQELAGAVEISFTPQETAWRTPLDEDTEHATYDSEQVERYFRAASRAAQVLAELRAPWRGRSTPVNAWWGAFDLGLNLYSGRPAEPPSDDFIFANSMDAQEIAVGWWPGDGRYERAAFYAYAHPSGPKFPGADLPSGHWEATLGEYVLDWDDVVRSTDPHATAVGFGRSVARHACLTCDWEPELAASLEARPLNSQERFTRTRGGQGSASAP
jgi:hypothetical protein